MWKAEEDFPRGGRRKPLPSKDIQQERDDDDDDDDDDGFEEQENLHGKSNAVEGNKRSKKRKLSAKDETVEQGVAKKPRKEKRAVIIDMPLQDELRPDLCVLACVSQAGDYNLTVSLPGHHTATLPITQVAPAYTQQLHLLAQADDPSVIEEVSPIEKLFRPGLLLPVKITDVDEAKQNKKSVVKVSCAPAAVNAGLPVKAVTNGQLLFGSISSIEDHGYRVDLGIKGVQAFLTSKDAEKLESKQGSSLGVGQPVWCVVRVRDSGSLSTGESRAVNVTVDPDLVRSSQLSDTSNLDSLRPGMTVSATVQSVSPSGVSVAVFTFQGYIHRTQLGSSSSQYKPGQQIKAKILYVNPASKDLYLTNLSRHMEFDGTAIDFFGDLQRGSFSEGKTSRTVRGKGVYFSLPGKVKAFAAISHLSDDEKETKDLTRVQKGQTWKCRVLGFNFMEGIALVSLKQSVLDQKFLSIKDISVGEILEATIKDVSLNGLVVKISKGIFSFIPCMHLADVPIKHPEKRFEAGQKVKCRVLKVDTSKRKVMLTLKKSLVKMKGEILTDYGQLKPYMELEGYIMAVKDTAVVVAFFNGVQGYVTLKDMSTEKVVDPSALFYKGQVIRCRVVHFNVEEKRLKLSFNFGEKKPKMQQKEQPTENEFELGKCVKVKIVREEAEGFKVQGVSSRYPAVLPFSHLSDFHEVQELRRLALKPGQVIDEVTFFTAKSRVVVTMKESILQAAKDNKVISSFDDIAVGALLPGVIKNHQDYGMFLEVAGGYIGLCPAKMMTSVQPASLQTLFPCGQSVVARITRLDTEKKRFLGTVRLDECYEGGLEASLALLHGFLRARDQAATLLYAERDDLKAYADLMVGSKVKVKVTSVLKKGILGELPSGANALATKHHFGGIKPEEGASYDAVVLFVDPLTPCVELTIEPKIVKAISSLKENAKTQAKSGQVLKADVLLVKPDFMLMCARGHAQGRLLYVPVRQHMNDLDSGKPYKPGTFTEVVIKESFNGHQVAVLKSQDPDAGKKAGSLDTNNIRSHNYKPGEIIDARIRAVHPLQLNIEVGKVHGRVHITEIKDDPEPGTNPLRGFKQGHTIKALVIGLRDVKNERYLPITNTNAKRSLLECSLRESKLENTTSEENLKPQLDLEVGQEVTGFVISVSPQKVWFQLSLSQQGYVDHFHLTEDLARVADLKFQPGVAHRVTVTGLEDQRKVTLSCIGKRLVVEEGAVVPAQVTSLKPMCSIHVKLPDGRPGVVWSPPGVLHYQGQLIMVKVDKVAGLDVCVLSLVDNKPIVLQRSHGRKGGPQEEEAKLHQMELAATRRKLRKEKRKRKLSQTDDQGDDSGVDVAKEFATESDKEPAAPEKHVPAEAIDDTTTPRLSIAGFSWHGDIATDVQKKRTSQVDDDDDDDAVPVDSKAKKKRKRDEEKLIQEYERSQLDGTAALQTAQDYEKLTLQSPHSSLVWLRYMAFHVELGEVEKARAVAERALNTISFREEQEKKNVWLAYLNLETTYGEMADVKKLLDRALAYNDPVDISLKMCEIYSSNNKMEDAEQLYTVLTRKYKKDKSVWKAYGQFLYRAGRLQSARNLLQRCTATLDKRDHVEVITRFANLEFSHGDAERGRTIFENLIASYPGRTDLWSVYVDLVAKSGDVPGARDILERGVKQKFAAKKLAFLINKMIRFEEAHGTDAQIQKAKDMALTLLEA